MGTICLKIKNMSKPVDIVYNRMKDYISRGLVPLIKKKQVFAYVVVFKHGKAITRRVKAKSTYSGGAV